MLVFHDKIQGHLRLCNPFIAGDENATSPTHGSANRADAETLQPALSEEFRGQMVSSPDQLPPHLRSLFAAEFERR